MHARSQILVRGQERKSVAGKATTRLANAVQHDNRVACYPHAWLDDNTAGSCDVRLYVCRRASRQLHNATECGGEK
jgi:hypothetical protein